MEISKPKIAGIRLIRESDLRSEKSVSQELVKSAKAMLVAKLHLIEGCRRVCKCCEKTDNPDNELFTTFQAIDSETDHFPLGEVKKYCEPDYLKRVDKEIKEYLSAAQEDIHKACELLIKTFTLVG